MAESARVLKTLKMRENNDKLLSHIQGAKAELAKRSLAEFVKQSWHVIEPTTPLIWNWHIEVICQHVQALLEGRLGKNNLLVNVPPGSMKSTIISVCVPPWMWLRNPSWRGLFISGNESVAIRDSIKCRDILTSEWYQNTFRPRWTFAKDQRAKGNYKNSASGFRKSTTAGSKITGDRSDDIFVDDPNDAQSVMSQVKRDTINFWWDNAAANRLNNLITGKRCIIQQRLHEEDLTGHVLSKDPGNWDALVIRQEFEVPKETDPDFLPTSLGWRDNRLSGELMFPERFPETVLAGERRRLRATGYAGQHQQRPAPAEGAIFKREDWRWYRPPQPWDTLDDSGRRMQLHALGINQVLQSWDIAIGGKQSNDYTACCTLGIAQNKYYILDIWTAQCEYPEAKRQVQLLYDKWRPHRVTVEGGGATGGKSIIQELRRETRIPFKETKTSSDKVMRARLISPNQESGLCYLPEGEPWVADFYESCSVFPAGKHDDDVDSFIMAMEEATTPGSRKLQITESLLNKLAR